METTEQESTVTTLHFSVEGEYLTNLARQMWVEETPQKAVRILTESLVGLPEDMAIDICTGKKKICGDTKVDESLWVEPDKATKCCGISLNVKFMQNRLIDRYERTHADIMRLEDALEFSLPYEEHKRNAKILEKNEDLIGELEEQIRFIDKLVGGKPTDFAYIKKIAEKKLAKRTTDAIRVQMEIDNMLANDEVKSLDWDMAHAIERLMNEQRDKLQHYQELGVIPHHFFNDFRSQQNFLDKKRGKHIYAEDIRTTDWLSGWIDPDGKLYGCPDMDHINFSARLFEYGIVKDNTENNYDRTLEKRGWIKFSQGRFFYMEDDMKRNHGKPTEMQIRTILNFIKKLNYDKIYINRGHISKEKIELW